MAFGFVDLANQRLHFLVGQWDLAADLKFIEGSQKLDTAGRAVQDLTEIFRPYRNHDRGWRLEENPRERLIGTRPFKLEPIKSRKTFQTTYGGVWKKNLTKGIPNPHTADWVSSMIKMEG
jgi:hypothetical protein